MYSVVLPSMKDRQLSITAYGPGTKPGNLGLQFAGSVLVFWRCRICDVYEAPGVFRCKDKLSCSSIAALKVFVNVRWFFLS